MSDTIQQCTAVTKAGNRCKNNAKEGSLFCGVHQKYGAEETVAAAPAEAAAAEQDPRLQELIAELDELVQDLKQSVPKENRSPYSPLHMLTLLRENVTKLAPDVQLGMLESFEGMNREDLLDIETWKGMAYMAGYSARFQAGQMREKMNESLPEPLKPDSVLSFMKQNFDRFAPDIAKEVVSSFEGATTEDLMDVDTWKGVFYMLNYSLQFQAQQWKQRITGEEDDA